MTQIFAHRGYSAVYSENTMTAFMEAQKAGADGLELDVQLTKDGEIVVIHDEKVDRTTSGTGWVKDFTYNDLRRLNANVNNKTLVKKESIPSLIEVFEWMKSNNIICNIELKNGIIPYEGMEEKVIALATNFGLKDRIVISSFNHYSIVKCYRFAPDIETAPLYTEGLYMPWVYAKSIGAKGIHPKHSSAPNEIIVEAMQNGIAVRPYTVNKEEDMRRLLQVQCSAFVTDDPVKALKLKAQWKRDYV